MPDRVGGTNPRSRQGPIAVAALVLGLMLALQLRTHGTVDRIDLVRSQELAGMLKSAETERDKLRDEVDDLRSKLTTADQGSKSAAAVKDELDKTRIVAGLTSVTGPGVSVMLDDSKVVRQKNEDPNAFLLHDDDILKVLNELSAAGAEAMSINGQRVIATTEVRCAGPTISVNNTRIAPPIQIFAIGDSATLENALRMRGGVLESLSVWGIEARVRRENTLTIPAYKGSLQFKYAKPVGGQ